MISTLVGCPRALVFYVRSDILHYQGRVVYSVSSNRSLVADNYKQKRIQFYNPRNAPFLDHYRYGRIAILADSRH